jgi:hypothetical protein
MRKTCADCEKPFEAKRATAKFCSDLCRVRAQRKGKSRAAPGPESGPGLVESSVRADIAALMTAHPMGEALTAMSLALARALDQGRGLMGIAAINRELRENLTELSRLAVDDGDDLADDLSEPELPAAVRDSEES